MGRRRTPEPSPTAEPHVRQESDGSVTVFLDGHPQSHLSPADPALIAFDYMQHITAAANALDPTASAFTHVGGAGLTLPRYFHATRPGTTHIVFEPNTSLTEAVRAAIPLPRGHRIRVRPLLGEVGVTRLTPHSCQVMIVDAFHQGRVPAALTTTEFYQHAASALVEGGLLLHNLADEPDRRYLDRALASMAAAGLLPQARISTHDVLKGRRYGNHVIVASATPRDLNELDRVLRRCPAPCSYRPCPTPTAAPFTCADSAASPAPPHQGTWRAV